jgi:ankyrin repeat protein
MRSLRILQRKQTECKPIIELSWSSHRLMPPYRFRWVFCQLEILRHCFPTDVRHILKELPESLDETYGRILKQIHKSNRQHAFRLLQCLTVAIRPLRVEELAEVLALDLRKGAMPKLNADWRWEDQEEAVLSACSSLVAIITDNGSRVVQFSHFSVKEFLTSDRLASSFKEMSQFHIPIEPSHVILAKACFSVLLRLDDLTDKDSVKNIPLFPYANAHWVGHAQIGNVELQIKDALDHFVDMDRPHFSAWVRVKGGPHFLKVSAFEQPRTTSPSSAPLYLAAMSGLRHLVERLIIQHPQLVNLLGGQYGTPLHASVLGRQIEVSRLLLVHGADVNARSTDQSTPLHLAARIGQLEVVRMLLEHNAEVEARNDQNETPLMCAADNRNHHVVQLLLDYNADEHVRANGNTTPLLYATAFGNLEVARLLLQRHADVNARDDNGTTSFLHAAHFGILRVVQLLLDYNADEHARDDNGNTALHLAAARGHVEIVRLLLERRAEIGAQNDVGSTPLHRASEGFKEGSTGAVRFLLDYGADVQVRNHGGKTASEVVRGPKKEEIVLLLSKHASE